MDDQLRELLSRQLDGDLDDDDQRRLQGLVEGDPQVRAELRGLAEVRAAVQRVARGEDPPRRLDEVLSPLRRSAPAASQGGGWEKLESTEPYGIFRRNICLFQMNMA